MEVPASAPVATRLIARALRVAALVWVVAAAFDVIMGLVRAQLWEAHEAGIPLAEVAERLAVVSWVSSGVHAIATIAVIVLAGRWAGAPGRGGVLVRVGQWIIGLTLALQLALLASWSAVTEVEQMELLQHANLVVLVLWFLGLTSLLAGTRAPAVVRGGFMLLATAWVAFVLWVRASDPPPELPPALFMLVPALLAVWWAAGLWLAAPAYAADEPAAARPSEDPIRRQAADGLALLRAGFVARIALSVAAVTTLVLLRSSPGAAGAVAWIFALLQCGLAVVIATGLTRYAALASDALERGGVTVVLMCLATGALLELYGAAQMAELLGYAARAQAATSMWDMPSMREAESVQTRATWLGRIASAVGLVAAVSLALSLRKTALWLDDHGNAARASTLVVLTILGGGTAVVLLALAQSGTVRHMAPIVGMMLLALSLAIFVLVSWLQLIGQLATRLRSESPPPGDAGT